MKNSSLPEVSFETPLWLIYSYHSTGSISLILNVFVLFLILFKSDELDNFRFFLLSFQIACTVTDVHLTFLMEPVPLHPLMAGYCTGILADLGVWTHYLAAFIYTIVVFQMECLTFCFARKHQTIARIVSHHVVPKWVWISGFVSAGVIPFVYFFAFCQAGMDRDKQLEYVEENYPAYLSQFQSLSNFAIYHLNFYFIFLTIITICGGMLSGFVFFFSTFDMFRMLKKARQKVSQAHYQRHKSAIRSLLAQFATSSLCLAPPFIFVLVVLGEFGESQLIVQCILILLSLHSPTNAVVLILTTAPYRKYLFRKPSSTVSSSKIKVLSQSSS